MLCTRKTQPKENHLDVSLSPYHKGIIEPIAPQDPPKIRISTENSGYPQEALVRHQVPQTTLKLPPKMSNMKQSNGTLNNGAGTSRDFPEWTQLRIQWKIISNVLEYVPCKNKNPRAQCQKRHNTGKFTGGRAASPTNPKKGCTCKRKIK